MLAWLVLLKLLATATALDNGVGLTPPMGWLSWLYTGCTTDCVAEPKRCLSEQLIKRTADRLVADGYRDAGYKYVVIDDCWPERERGPDGRIIPDRTRFKGGIKALADYVHSKGLKFGIYGDIGTLTCAGYPGSAGHEALDIQTFVEWGVDYIKVDGCWQNETLYESTYPNFGKLLNKTGRPIHYSCSWPAYQEGKMKVDYEAISKTCNTWRNYADIAASWNSLLGIVDWFGDNRDRLAPYSGPGHFHDPDMLIAGHPEVSAGIAIAQIAIWAVLAAPLMISADLDTISKEMKEVLLWDVAIKHQQDPAGLMGYRIEHNDRSDLWIHTSTIDGSVLIAGFTRDLNDMVTIHVPRKKLGLKSGIYKIQRALADSTENVHIVDELVLKLTPQDANVFLLTALKNETFVEDNNIL